MGMTVGIKSSGDRHLDLHFSSSNQDGNGKWGSLHISICAMQWMGPQLVPALSLQCELEHDDIDRLIMELQRAKGMLAGGEHDFFKDAGVWREPEKIFAESKRRELFEPPAIPAPDEVCQLCGTAFKDHAYSGACLVRCDDGKFEFSKTQRFT